MAQDQDSTDAKSPKRGRVIVVGIGALLLAIITAVGTGLGEEVVDRFKSDPKLITSSAKEDVYECGTQLFVQGEESGEIASGALPVEPQWADFAREHDAVIADQNVVEVSIQGESERKITLTKIEFEVEKRPRPSGAVFTNPCGDGIYGRAVQADLDRTPVQIVDSIDDPELPLGSLTGSQRKFKQIRFPWTVSLTDPLILRVVAKTKRCYCTWRAYITWRSGDKSGRIPIDNDGKGYRVAGLDGLRSWVRSPDESTGWRDLSAQQ